MQRSIKVRIIKETPSKVTLRFITLNRTIPIPRADFDERVASGLYQLVQPLTI